MSPDPYKAPPQPHGNLGAAPNDSPLPSEVETAPPASSPAAQSLPWSLIAAIVFFSAVISVSSTFFAGKAIPGLASAGNTVTFDAIRFTNAQRAVASQLAFKNSVSSAQATENAIILNQSARVEHTIRELVGPDTLVLVKQAVVDSEYPDITDEVLRRLGLPTNVPSIQPDVSPDGYSEARRLLAAPEPKTSEGVLP